MSSVVPVVYFAEPEAFSGWALEEAGRRYKITGEVETAVAVFVRVGCRVDAALLERMPRLRVVVSPTTGEDHLDKNECRRRGVQVLTLKGETAFLEELPNTAEHAFGMLLALTRKLQPACRSVLAGRWVQAPFRGHTLAGKSFGIVGCGRLGSLAARMARGFDMRVLAYDPYIEEVPEHVERMDTMADLTDRADILSLHADLNDTSFGIVDETVLEAMKTHAVIVNTARGQLIDEDALLDALRRNLIAGAALDVVRDESGFSSENPLVRYAVDHDNLLITPHIGGQTHEAVRVADQYMFSKLDTWWEEYGD